jgi:hypothetical protein
MKTRAALLEQQRKSEEIIISFYQKSIVAATWPHCKKKYSERVEKITHWQSVD